MGFDDITLIYKVFSVIRGWLFWKNNKIIYINSNKKIQSMSSIDEVTSTREYKFVNCQTSFKQLTDIKFYKHHLIKMKKHLYDILRNAVDFDEMVYSGFVSPMFAAYDGFCLGDNKKFIFIDVDSKNSKPYKVEYFKDFSKPEKLPAPTTEIVDVFYSYSYEINQIDSKNSKFVFDLRCDDEVNAELLKKVFSFSKSVFDLCKDSKVKEIHLYISAKQPISFIIGTAIQSYHPKIIAYEYVNGEYKYPFWIQSGKFEELK